MAAIKPEIIDQICKNSVPLFDFLNVSFEFLADGVFQCHMPKERKVSNHLGSVYAGVQWSLAEVLGGIVFLSSGINGYVPILKSMSIDFTKPALTDLVSEVRFTSNDVNEMKKSLDKDGRYNFELESNVKDINGNIVATGHAVYAIRKVR
ncbi:MAG: hypothetical protein ACJA0E_000197 [Bermanella sp.]|jgi:uncharacterized protein (TIGR00369 family)